MRDWSNLFIGSQRLINYCGKMYTKTAFEREFMGEGVSKQTINDRLREIQITNSRPYTNEEYIAAVMNPYTPKQRKQREVQSKYLINIFGVKYSLWTYNKIFGKISKDVLRRRIQHFKHDKHRDPNEQELLLMCLNDFYKIVPKTLSDEERRQRYFKSASEEKVFGIFVSKKKAARIKRNFEEKRYL